MYMYIPPPYRENRYHEFTVVYDGKFYLCRCIWSVRRTDDNDFVLSVFKRCSEFFIEMHLHVLKVQRGLKRFLYATTVVTRA